MLLLSSAAVSPSDLGMQKIKRDAGMSNGLQWDYGLRGPSVAASFPLCPNQDCSVHALPKQWAGTWAWISRLNTDFFGFYEAAFIAMLRSDFI